MVYDTNKDIPYIEPAPYSLESLEIYVQDVKDVLFLINVSKAPGPDLISPPSPEGRGLKNIHQVT